MKRKRCHQHCPCRVPQGKKYWERRPGYFAHEEWPRERAKIGQEWWPSLQDVFVPQSNWGTQSVALRQAVAGCLRDYIAPARMTHAQRVTELTRQSKRLGRHNEA